MNHLLLSLLFVLSACAASAEVRRSSRNLQPLTSSKNDAQTSSSASGNSGMGVSTTPKPSPQTPETVTRVTFVGPKSGWGFLQTRSPHYSPDGKNLGPLPGGTLFKYTDVKTTSKNAVLVSLVKRGDAWDGPFLLDCTDVAAYEGSPEEISPETVGRLADYFTIKGRIDDRKTELAEAAASANPHYGPAKKAQQAYRDSLDQATEMERQMNALSGARKSKALDALRAFKYEQVRIKAQADAEAEAYKAWKDAHPAPAASAAADPQLKALEQALQTAAAKIPGLIPSAS